MKAIVLLLVMIAVVVTPFAFAIGILRRLDNAAKIRKANVKYHVADLFGLFFLVQLPLAMIVGRFENNEAKIAGVVLAAAMLLVGWTTIKTVSRAGINHPVWRILVSLIVIPSTYIGSFAFVVVMSLLIFESDSSFLNVGIALLTISGLILSSWITNRAISNTMIDES